jgi:hypothetical protein
MRSESGFRFMVFGFQKLRAIIASCFLFSAFDPFKVSNLKSQIRAAQGGR